jgi:hypothetical protein
VSRTERLDRSNRRLPLLAGVMSKYEPVR